MFSNKLQNLFKYSKISDLFWCSFVLWLRWMSMSNQGSVLINHLHLNFSQSITVFSASFLFDFICFKRLSSNLDTLISEIKFTDKCINIKTINSSCDNLTMITCCLLTVHSFFFPVTPAFRNRDNLKEVIQNTGPMGAGRVYYAGLLFHTVEPHLYSPLSHSPLLPSS